MNKLPKEIYVPEESDEPIYFTNAKECARDNEAVTVAVYKLVGKVEVSTRINYEVIVKKSKKPTAAKADPAPTPVDREALMDAMRIATTS